jgi:hypothetical protein
VHGSTTVALSAPASASLAVPPHPPRTKPHPPDNCAEAVAAAAAAVKTYYLQTTGLHIFSARISRGAKWDLSVEQSEKVLAAVHQLNSILTKFLHFIPLHNKKKKRCYRISRVVSLWPPRYVRASSARGDTLDRKMRPSKHPDGAGNVGPRKMLSSSQTILLD